LTTHVPGDSRSLDFSKKANPTGFPFYSSEVLCHATQKVGLVCPEQGRVEKCNPRATAAKVENKIIDPTIPFLGDCQTSSEFHPPGKEWSQIFIGKHACVVFQLCNAEHLQFIETG